jgi:hypothetical protein
VLSGNHEHPVAGLIHRLLSGALEALTRSAFLTPGSDEAERQRREPVGFPSARSTSLPKIGPGSDVVIQLRA